MGVLKQHKYQQFLASMILLLLLYPFIVGGEGTSSFARLLFAALSTVVLVAGMHASCTSRRQLITGGLLAFVTLLAVWLAPQLVDDETPEVSTTLKLLVACPALFYFYVGGVTLSFVLRGEKVDGERIAAALCVYMLFGFGFSTVYVLVQGVNSESFVSTHDAELTWPDFVFYSFVTMTTLGYGDITPVTAQARSLAVVQTVAGVFYMAVLIAGLVGGRREPAGRASDADGDSS
jgi:hypothetical protein